MPHSERAGSCCSEGCVGWVYRFSPGASTVPALDKLSLTERNLQQVVSRSDLNLEQRERAEKALAKKNFLKTALLEVR